MTRFERRHYTSDWTNVENYEKAKADNFKGWVCHHRLETHNSDGERRPVDISKDELKALDMYFNRPASELIFMTSSDHIRLHKVGKPAWNIGKHHSKECRKKISYALKGNKNMLGKHHSDKSRNKMSEAKKGKHWKLVDGKRVYY